MDAAQLLKSIDEARTYAAENIAGEHRPYPRQYDEMESRIRAIKEAFDALQRQEGEWREQEGVVI